MVFFSPDMVGVFLNFQQAWWWCFLFLIFTWDGGGWQVANKTAALWEAQAGILRKANLRRQLSCFGEERNAWSDGNNTLNQGRLSASSCSNGKMLENATKKRFESKSFEPCICR